MFRGPWERSGLSCFQKGTKRPTNQGKSHNGGNICKLRNGKSTKPRKEVGRKETQKKVDRASGGSNLRIEHDAV